ncbi:MAG: formylglycine-generating enzyme family protein [Saprospiraceae bacterium]|nr:formylglycine-generating enzyme family protein [Saprospiraceae bacterium]MCF8249436.1 formylglycine-generating enzyme family protein [Saprospiraceae bacterium]MCF8279090.1 formylglycine-generating enzyme family protein [Bacteroidales bacterium]MCF8311565.1 formylglycine-generating enzyme family protein [Saprospiraceae bacterium]MCF8440055.1 formylglycine-generating enzyme family protein [Saprospiraceae bacterium]
MIFVEGGDFLMGKGKDAHPVRVNSFYMAKYQVTQALWQAIMGENQSKIIGENRPPVETVSWDDAQEFIKQLSKATSKAFRLPTEAEWEFAAHGGIYSQGCIFAGSDKLKQVGWHHENSGNETHDVGLLLANELGIHDLSGHVWEWCEDDYHDSYKVAPKDGSAWTDAPDRRVMRGGSYFSDADGRHPANCDRWTPGSGGCGIGFRLVFSPSSSAS